MSLDTGILAAVRRVESFRTSYRQPISANILNGKLANYVAPGAEGWLKTIESLSGVPRGYTGEIYLESLQGGKLLWVPNLQMQFELGAKEGPWTVIANYWGQGLEVISDRQMGFRYAGKESDTTFLIEMAVSDNPNLKEAFDEINTFFKKKAA